MLVTVYVCEKPMNQPWTIVYQIICTAFSVKYSMACIGWIGSSAAVFVKVVVSSSGLLCGLIIVWYYSICVELERHHCCAVVGELKNVVKTLFDIPADREIRLWNNYMNNTYECLAKLTDEDTLQDGSFYSGNTVVVETKKDDGSWQREENNVKS